jgi:hypothetical protein
LYLGDRLTEMEVSEFILEIIRRGGSKMLGRGQSVSDIVKEAEDDEEWIYRVDLNISELVRMLCVTD